MPFSRLEEVLNCCCLGSSSFIPRFYSFLNLHEVCKLLPQKGVVSGRYLKPHLFQTFGEKHQTYSLQTEAQ